MNYREAEDRFRMLENRRERGVLSQEQYRAELNRLRVTDAEGRLWMLQERTGQWHVYQDGRWIASEPPSAARSTPPPVAVTSEPAPRRRSEPPMPAKEGGGCRKTALYLIAWASLWTIVAVVVYLVWGRDEPMGLVGVALAAVISLIFLLFNLGSQWSGEIVDIRMERVRVDHGEDDWHYEDRRFAYVRRDSGKTKRMEAPRKWQIGDRLEKRRGEGQLRHYPHR